MQRTVIEGESVLCFAPGPWDSIWRNRHHIMSRLALYNKVLYVEPVPYFKPALRRLVTGAIKPPDVFGPRLKSIQDGLFVYRPNPLLPISGKAPLSTVTSVLRKRLLERSMEKLGMGDPILWLNRPEMHCLIGQFREKLSVYHVVDEYSAYQGVTPSLRAYLRQSELRMLNVVDLVIVVSESLYRARSLINDHTYIMPNGVDYEAFKSLEADIGRPYDLRDIRGRILGYIGLISARLDLACLRGLVENIPGVSLVLLGSVDRSGAGKELQELLSLPGVHYLGRKSPTEIPVYLRHFDVGLIPYRMAEEAMNADPLKAYEYLASGKPVVATNIPSLQRFAQLVRLASSPAEFLTGVRDVLAGEDPNLPANRRRLAERNSWENRVGQISHLLETHLSRVSGTAGRS